MLVVLCAAPAARGENVLRMATAAPDGSGWARELTNFTRQVLADTHGGLRIKWYFGGTAGGELEMGERMKRGQLDGVASGGMLCHKHAPSTRVARVRGLFLDREESAYVRERLKPVFESELKRAGLVLLATADLGADIVLSRHPLRSLDDLRRAKLWRWDLDEVGALLDREMGISTVPLPLEAAGPAYDQERVDGFLAIPAAALAFQWFSRARYQTELPMGYLWACLLVRDSAFDRLPFEQQQLLRTATARLAARLKDVGAAMDEQLLGGLFEKNGLKRVVASEAQRREFFSQSLQARERLGEKLVPAELLTKVQSMLADRRAEKLRAK
jgi:TRAP-type C4-dicarboxylate transport system substrate-binding protein